MELVIDYYRFSQECCFLKTLFFFATFPLLYPKAQAAAPKLPAVFSSNEHIGKTPNSRIRSKIDRDRSSPTFKKK